MLTCPRFTPHDLRRTVMTRLGDLGVLPHVVEKIANHTMEGVMAVYNRQEYLPERKEAMDRWGGHVQRLVICQKLGPELAPALCR